jgi:hypothetical protein
MGVGAVNVAVCRIEADYFYQTGGRLAISLMLKK